MVMICNSRPDPTVFDLTFPCLECGYEIKLSEIQFADGEHLKCPSCENAKAHELAERDRRKLLALRFACPICKVPPGSPCFRESNDGWKVPLLQPHAKRFKKQVVPTRFRDETSKSREEKQESPQEI